MGRGRSLTAALATTGFLLLSAGPADAYVGPGAGFVLAPLFIGLFVGLLAVVVVLSLPFYLVFRLLFAKPVPRGRFRRVVVIGFDGMDPGLAREYMEAGRMPNLSALAEEGSFSPLAIPVPSISPSSWSSFSSGADASRHCIFDFLTRDPCSYLPELSSVEVKGPRRSLKLGPYRIPLGRPVVRLLRKSRPFWKVLSESRVDSSIHRVPVTFPPDEFKGRMLSGMCVPDLKGTQGSFSFFTTEKPAGVDAPGLGYGGDTGGIVTRVTREGERVRGEIVGPRNTIREDGGDLTVPFTAEIRPGGGVRLTVGRERIDLGVGEWSAWVRLTFKPGLGLKVRGLAKFHLVSTDPEFGLYVSPIQIDPEKPALTISNPSLYSVYLARLNGPFATLGLAEDTWALNERILTEEAFLEQAWANHEEREKQLFTALDTTRRGCVTVVFDATDRISHMFWRYREPDHPANEGKDSENHRHAIRDLYERMDELVGRLRKKLRRDDALVVLSDHGFTSFRRGVNLNTWLRQEGYLHLKEGCEEPGEWFEGVDWTRTKAFTLGLTGLFLNRRGREGQGVVAEGEEAGALKRELIQKLEALTDPATGARAIRKMYDAEAVYDGPYAAEAPDLLIGYDRGYRNSWEAATGRVTEEVFTDNVKSWSGDHCVDPDVVPGVLFTSFVPGDRPPSMTDLAPTILDLLGVETPGYMTGRSLLNGEAPA